MSLLILLDETPDYGVPVPVTPIDYVESQDRQEFQLGINTELRYNLGLNTSLNFYLGVNNELRFNLGI